MKKKKKVKEVLKENSIEVVEENKNPEDIEKSFVIIEDVVDPSDAIINMEVESTIMEQTKDVGVSNGEN